jgi:hypothetical protein
MLRLYLNGLEDYFAASGSNVGFTSNSQSNGSCESFASGARASPTFYVK